MYAIASREPLHVKDRLPDKVTTCALAHFLTCAPDRKRTCALENMTKTAWNMTKTACAHVSSLSAANLRIYAN
jgi:hypothetical protein